MKLCAYFDTINIAVASSDCVREAHISFPHVQLACEPAHTICIRTSFAWFGG